ncbi:MAG: B12-binding domain-containing radical SAM protein, partial [Desulfobulbaceae bacterium]|nr:B12-binding domain-containing radical SAM protein [Desulfobulbaceae bacterium]
FMPAVTPISLGNLGAELKASGHDVKVLSLGSASRFSLKGLLSFLKDFKPRLVGFGTYQRNIFQVRAVAGMVKEAFPDCSVVLGGPQTTFLPDEAILIMPEIDYVSRGEGELTIKAIVEAIEGGGGDEPVPGVTLRTKDGQCITGPPLADLPKNLDCYASPWLTGVLDPADMEESIMLTSRGCPNNCAFCFTPRAFGRQTRSQSVERVLEDIACICKAGPARLWFADPNFSFSNKRVVGILEGILSRELNVAMWIETRADMLTPELIVLMKRAGVHSIAMGLESVSPNVYPRLNKSIEPEKIGDAARTALKAGLDVELFSQYALPGERLEDAMQTLQFVKDCGVAIRGNSNAQQMQLYFGSRIHANYQEYGIRPLRDDMPPYLTIGTDFETEWMSREE